MDKRVCSNVENTREKFEEPIATMGRAIIQQQIWRDSMLLPEVAPAPSTLYEDTNEFGNYKYSVVKKYQIGTAMKNLVKYYEQLPLGRVPGTTNCYSAEDLKEIITDVFGKSYLPTLYLDGNKLAYGMGDPVIDETAGTIYFQDQDFVKNIGNSAVSITFYRYMGRKGTFGTDIEGGMELPFYDTMPHFVDARTMDTTATIKVRGDKGKNTDYVLPPNNGKYYDKGDAEDTGVVLLQENLEDALWEQNTKISGGAWVSIKGEHKVYKYGLPNEDAQDAKKNK